MKKNISVIAPSKIKQTVVNYFVFDYILKSLIYSLKSFNYFKYIKMNNLNKLVKDSVNYFKLVNRSSRFYYKLALSIGICSLGITFMTNYYLKRKRQLKLTSKTSKIIDMVNS